MRILVLGGAGYIGSRLCPYLAQEGHEVIVMDTFWFGDYLPETVTKIKKNIKDIAPEDFRGVETVIFLAGLSNDPMSEFLPMDCFIQNGAIPGYAALKAKEAGVKRFIYASTCSVYGYSPDKLKTPEDKIVCNYPYGLSKYMGECGVMALKDDFFTPIALRMGTISGWSPKMRFDLLINTMYKNAVGKGIITISDPALNRPMLFINDALVIYERLLHFSSGIYNGVSFNSTLGEIAREVGGWMVEQGMNPPEYKVKFVGDLRNYRADGSLWGDVLYETNTWDILDEIHSYHESYGDMEDIKYNNGASFKKLIEEGKYE